ncbi:hypothetical protein PILCRDRAFT_817582 [Piloderma croceum F 1598]|uniref:Uncharacterized protein n=1 Tax=Piloderma croceum (strain F 1598) TaxID=765440 RepID=A0A0C3FL85_PILCF|nr:hypothetical protein PILCRDRAFT_817582 [Piloderma croceum F 1598]
MARERRNMHPQASSSDLLSGVFSFVSREIESFVTTATGGEVRNYDENKPSSSRGEIREQIINAKEDHRGRHRSGSRARHSDHSDIHETSTSSRQARSQDRIRHHDPRTPTPSPPPPPELHPSLQQRTQPVSMPGSLFPRSPSLLPDLPPHYMDERDDRRVRFENEGPSRPRDIPHPRTPFDKATSGSYSSPVSASMSPLDRRGVPSVRDAVRRFRVEDANASILLPRETVSPGKGKGKAREDEYTVSPPPSSRDKGKQRARDVDGHEHEYMHAAETSDEVRVRGKERELVEARDKQMRRERRKERDRDTDVDGREREKDKERIRMLEEEIRKLKEELSKRPINTAPLPAPPPPPPPPLPPGSTSTTRPHTTSNPTTPAQDALFANARAALKHTSQPVEQPINYGGLGARAKRTGQPTVNIAGEKMAAFLSEMKSVRLKKVGPGGGAGASGGNIGSREGSMGASGSGLARRWSSGGSLDQRDTVAEANSSLTRRGLPSFRSLRNRTDNSSIGDKRKRSGEAQDDIQNAAKRRVVSSSFASTYTMPSQPTSTQLTDPNSNYSGSSSYPRPPSQPHPANRTWPIIATEADLTTPELLSDNEREGDSSLDDRYRLPSTPPVLGTRTMASANEKQRMDADVDMDMDGPQRQRATGSPRIRRESELFSKRPPTSPMLLDTPRKLRPPARPLGRATPRSTARSKSKSGRDGGDDEEEDDPLALSFSSPDVVALSSLQSKEPTTTAAAPAAGGGKKKRRSPSRETFLEPRDPVPDSASTRSGSTNPARRCPTLDEELRQAHAQSLLHENGEEPDLDSGILVGVGTRSKKKGFLAHGGAGGVPVFMGDGYVDGVEVGEEEGEVDEGGNRDDDSDYSPKSKKNAGGGGRKRGPAAVGKRKGRR